MFTLTIYLFHTSVEIIATSDLRSHEPSYIVKRVVFLYTDCSQTFTQEAAMILYIFEKLKFNTTYSVLLIRFTQKLFKGWDCLTWPQCCSLNLWALCLADTQILNILGMMTLWNISEYLYKQTSRQAACSRP